MNHRPNPGQDLISSLPLPGGGFTHPTHSRLSTNYTSEAPTSNLPFPAHQNQLAPQPDQVSLFISLISKSSLTLIAVPLTITLEELQARVLTAEHQNEGSTLSRLSSHARLRSMIAVWGKSASSVLGPSILARTLITRENLFAFLLCLCRGRGYDALEVLVQEYGRGWN